MRVAVPTSLQWRPIVRQVRHRCSCWLDSRDRCEALGNHHSECAHIWPHLGTPVVFGHCIKLVWAGVSPGPRAPGTRSPAADCAVLARPAGGRLGRPGGDGADSAALAVSGGRSESGGGRSIGSQCVLSDAVPRSHSLLH